MAQRISGTTEPPAELSVFPTEKLVAGSVRMVPESVLGISALKRGYIAEYDYGKAFLVQEATPESAAAVMNKLRTRFGETTPAKVADEAFEASEKYLGRLCIFRKGRTLAGYANLPESADAVALAVKLVPRIP